MKRTPFKRKPPKKKRKKSPKKKLEERADKLFSEYILKRDGPWCVKCKRRKANQAHHIFTRSIKSIRHDPRNGLGLCSYCHTLDSYGSAHKNPEAFREWLIDYLGQEQFDALKLAANTKRGHDYEMAIIILERLLNKEGV